MKAKAPKKSVRKAKRAKKVTKASQTGSYRKVWNGTKLYTKGGLMKKDLMLNKNNRVVSKKMASARKANSKLSKWTKAT